jgi:hypothetical protein
VREGNEEKRKEGRRDGQGKGGKRPLNFEASKLLRCQYLLELINVEDINS